MVKKEVKIAILQMSSVIGDVETNVNKVKELTQNLSSDIDLLVLPEVWTCGWSCSHFIQTAQDIITSSIIDFLSELAKKNNVNIIGGSFISKKNDIYYNTCPVFNRKGELIATYNKNHLYSYYGCNEGDYITCGDKPVMVELDGINYGLTICYDIRFPEIYRAYAKAGADILINCAAWGSKKAIPWEVMTKSRAIENQCYMIALTQCGKIDENEYNLGVSRIIDYNGEEKALIENVEGLATAKLSIDEMYKFRAKAPTLKDIKENYEVKKLCLTK